MTTMIQRSLLAIGLIALLLDTAAAERVSLVDGDQGKPFRSSSEYGGRSPHLGNDLVIRKIAGFLWKDDQPARPFVIKGSYAASLWAFEHANGLILPYNDIDVFVETAAPSKLCLKREFVNSSYEHGLIPNSDIPVQVSTVCEWNPKQLIEEKSDINAIMVGFTVIPKVHENDSGDRLLIPEIESWTVSSHFKNFLQTQTLEIISGRHSPEKSAIRLMRKAQQLQMNYRLPDEEELDNLHGSVIHEAYKKALDDLEVTFKNEIYKRFDLKPIGKKCWNAKWHMLVLKGMMAPNPPRNIASCGYNDFQGYYDYGFQGYYGFQQITSKVESSAEVVFKTAWKAAAIITTAAASLAVILV